MTDIYSNTRVSSRVERLRKVAAERYSIKEKDTHIGHVILESMLDNPDMICQIDFATGQQETNKSVAKRMCCLASAMMKAGLKPGDPAIVMGPNHMDLCIPYFACHLGGYPMCGIDPSIGKNDLISLFPYISPKIIFCQKACEEKVNAALRQNKLKAKIVFFDDKTADIDAFVKMYTGTKVNFRPAEFDHSTTIAWLMLTSGTTGRPKVAVIPFDTLLNGIINWWSPFPDSVDTILAMATLQWVSSLIYFMSGPLKGATRVQSSEPLTPMKLVTLINQYRPVTTAFTPYILGHFLNAAEKTCDLSSFKYILIGGSAIEKPLLDRFRSVCSAFMYLAYGMTELLVPIFDFDNDTPFGSSGKPQSQYEFKLMGDDGVPLEGSHKTGELWVKGDSFFKGYLNNPEETKTILTDDGWFKTGDMFYRDDQDYYYFVERKRLLIKHYGFLISPLQIEEIIKRHPAVLDACVVSEPHMDCQELPLIALQRRNGDKVDPQEIFDLIRKTWTLRESEKKKIDALEMWCWRRMLGVSWTEFRTNASIIQELGVKQRLSSIVQCRILTFFGHITRREGVSVERLVVQGKVEGTRARGRSPMRWADQIKTALNGPLHECARRATVRDEWRRIVKLATTPDMTTTTTLPRV